MDIAARKPGSFAQTAPCAFRDLPCPDLPAKILLPDLPQIKGTSPAIPSRASRATINDKISDFQKFCLTLRPNQPYISRYPVPLRGALAIVTNVGTGCG